MNKGDRLYYAQIMPTVGLYEVLEIVIRTVHEDYFVGIEERNNKAYLFGYTAINKYVFYERDDALRKVLDAEQSFGQIFDEKYYEEY